MKRAESVKCGQVSLQERIRTQIESDILNGRRPPGSAIDEKDVAAAFNASRTPVREALIALSARGLVTIAARSGIYVRKASMAELVSALEAICELEVAVIGLAAKRSEKSDLERMRLALAECGQAVEAQDAQAYRDANTRLHEAIHQAAGNPVLAEYIRTSRSLLVAYRYRSFEVPGRLSESHDEHSQIVHAIERGDTSLAQSCMRVHITRGGEAMIALLRSSVDAFNE